MNKPNSRIHNIQNCNYVIELCMGQLGIKAINIGGLDIVDGKANLVLGLVWQLCKIYLEERVGHIHEDKLVKWANQYVPETLKIHSLEDKSLSSGLLILYVVNGVCPNSVDFKLVKESKSEEERIENINYALSCCRRIGAQVMTQWEDINNVNSRFISILLAELQYISKQS